MNRSSHSFPKNRSKFFIQEITIVKRVFFRNTHEYIHLYEEGSEFDNPDYEKKQPVTEQYPRRVPSPTEYPVCVESCYQLQTKSGSEN